ncbi:C-type lectin receptor-like tyrosine-protein kinase At1g52310 [Raphanus sativus]|uniref:C-type lectin receptor-like tyrosine-protein kinase At1g52310 n=1 Tax=Raphanus sativus TaxID=3726 RepID=A0A6J0KXQ8_RAPSA|nr:C-type lectin receptor-like tyrosine-protein kinase At1g52310 [Raphanus sativus]
MELTWGFCRKQALVLISCLFLLYLASLDTISSESSAQNAIGFKNRSHKVSCPTNWVLGPNQTKCFAYFRNSTSWEKSETLCIASGGHLASLSSNKELSFVQKLCNANATSCWIGGRSLNSSTVGFNWTWSDPKTPQWNQTMFPKVPVRTPCRNGSSSCGADICMVLTNGSLQVFGERCNASHAFICSVDSDTKCSNCHGEYKIILLVVSGLILFTTFAIILWFLIYKRSKKRRKSRKVSSPALVPPPSWKIFTSEELRSMTKNFSEANRLAGDAKTGGTYTGGLSDGTKVAVKRLKRSSFQRKKEFYSEIKRAAKLHHTNVVAIKGCCYDHGERFIVYEFIANGPLDRWLHHVPRGGRSLDWNMRLNIATTLAQGIAFLHDKVKPQVVHRDIRASNVLLDEEFGAHLMGVGLSKFVPWEVMQERTVMAGGTYGYLAPEYVYRNELTTKSDVYSFGVLLLEIVSGRRPTQAVNSSVGWQSIFEWATPLVQANRWLELLDPVITSGLPEASVVQKVVDLVYSCTQNVPSMRPRMSHVVHQLQLLVPPSEIVSS